MTYRWMMVAAALALTGCAEMHKRDGNFTASGYSFNVLFAQIPNDPMESANKHVPADAKITNVSGTPNSWKTLPGFVNRLLGVGWAQIGGTSESK